MTEPIKTGGGLGFIITLLTLLVGGLALEKQVFIKSSRPSYDTNAYYNRLVDKNFEIGLGEDPFRKVDQLVNSLKKQNSGKSDVIPTWLNFSHDLELKLNTLEETQKIIVLGILVDNSLSSMDVENRIRTRYAVVSGLASSGYRPETPEYIAYLDGADLGHVHFKQKAHIRPYFPPKRVPYEWFVSDDENPKEPKDSILVLWLDDDDFFLFENGKSYPLRNLQIFFRHLVAKLKVNFFWEKKNDPERLSHSKRDTFYNVVETDYSKFRFLVIGPSNSGRLREMVSEVSYYKTQRLNRHIPSIEIFSPRATIDEELVLQRHSKDSPYNSISKYFESINVRFLRTTPTDLVLAKALVRELELRGVTRNSHIALISEWDTSYGRAFKRTVCKAWKTFNWKNDVFEIEETLSNREVSLCDELKNIHYFSYLRNLDGQFPGPDNNGNVNKRSYSKELQNEQEVVSPLRAEQVQQYDYLLRLATKIEEEEKRISLDKTDIRAFGNSQFKAFGFMGSDFYDKQVLLQVLRNKFSHSQFFTTDMDARLFHSKDYKFVRNLIVASGFGLRLNDILQQKISPFRDTYQTSTYLATLLALEPVNSKSSLTQSSLDRWLQPRVFEIGRTRAFDISPMEKSEESKGIGFFNNFEVNTSKVFSLHPERISGIPAYKYPAIAILMLSLVIFLCLKYKEYWGWIISGYILMVGFFVLTFLLSLKWDEEPLAYLEGISIWPTEYFRLTGILIVVAVFLFYKGKLEENLDRIRMEFKYSGASVINNILPYEKSQFLKMVSWRMAVFIGLFFLIFFVSGPSLSPVRGTISSYLDQMILAAFIFSFGASLYFSGVHLNECIALLNGFKDGYPKWVDATQRKIFSEAIPGAVQFDPSGTTLFPDSTKAMLNGPVSLRYIAQKTDAVDKLIYFPFGIIAIGVLSRSRVFDNWDFPLSLWALVIYGALYILLKALVIQREAKKRKAELMDRLETQRIHFNVLGQEKEQEFLRLLIEDTQKFKKGAFMPLEDRAFYKALLLPFSSFGGMALLEYIFLAV